LRRSPQPGSSPNGWLATIAYSPGERHTADHLRALAETSARSSNGCRCT
jgi:hypothetical protein